MSRLRSRPFKMGASHIVSSSSSSTSSLSAVMPRFWEEGEQQQHSQIFDNFEDMIDSQQEMPYDGRPNHLNEDEDSRMPAVNECKEPRHNKLQLSFICRARDCENVLLCRLCRKSHDRSHKLQIQPLDSWFNRMFGRRVEDSENNKVSRRCGMQLGRLTDDSREFQECVDTRIAQIERSSEEMISQITSYITQKKNEQIELLSSLKQEKQQRLQRYQDEYKHLKSLNRFTILENLKRQHEINLPANPINSIVQYLLDNETQLADAEQIENHHKAFSKLLRDIDDFETSMKKKRACVEKTDLSSGVVAKIICEITEQIDSIFKRTQCGGAADKCCAEKQKKALLDEVQRGSSESDDDADDEVEEEYICETQENFNCATFVGFKNNSMHVLQNAKLFEYSLGSASFSKQHSLLSSSEITQGSSSSSSSNNSSNDSTNSDMSYQNCLEIGAMDEAVFFNDNRTVVIIGLKSDPAALICQDSSKQLCEYQNAHQCSITTIVVVETIAEQSIHFAAGSYDGAIKLWRFQRDIPSQTTFELTPIRVLTTHTDFITALIVHEDTALISASADRKIAIWDWKNNSSLPEKYSPATSPSSSSSSALATALESNNSLLPPTFLLAEAGLITTPPTSSSLAKKKKKKFLRGNSAFPSSEDPTMNQLLLGGEYSEIYPTRILPIVHSEKVNCLASLDDGFIASGSSDGTIRIWDSSDLSEFRFLANTYVVNAVSRLRKDVLVCSVNHVKLNYYRVNVWDWQTGNLLASINSHTGRITRVHAIPSGLVTCERNKIIRFWKNKHAPKKNKKPYVATSEFKLPKFLSTPPTVPAPNPVIYVTPPIKISESSLMGKSSFSSLPSSSSPSRNSLSPVSDSSTNSNNGSSNYITDCFEGYTRKAWSQSSINLSPSQIKINGFYETTTSMMTTVHTAGAAGNFESMAESVQNAENHPPSMLPHSPNSNRTNNSNIILGLRSLEGQNGMMMAMSLDESDTRYSHSAPCSPKIKGLLGVGGSGGSGAGVIKSRATLQKSKKSSRNLFGV